MNETYFNVVLFTSLHDQFVAHGDNSFDVVVMVIKGRWAGGVTLKLSKNWMNFWEKIFLIM